MPLFAEKPIFIFFFKIILIFHNGGEKMYKNINQGKTSELFFFTERKSAKIRSRKFSYRNTMNTIVYKISKCFWKESFYGIVWYAMLSYAMVWYGKYGMLWDFNAMLWDFYAMLCYAMFYVVKDKHSATILYIWIRYIFSILFTFL